MVHFLKTSKAFLHQRFPFYLSVCGGGEGIIYTNLFTFVSMDVRHSRCVFLKGLLSGFYGTFKAAFCQKM